MKSSLFRVGVATILTASLIALLEAKASAQVRSTGPPQSKVIDDKAGSGGMNVRPNQRIYGPVTPTPYPSSWMFGVYTQPVRLSNGQVGLQITSIVPNTAAARMQFDPGDIVVISNGYSMQSPDQLRWSVANSGGTLDLTFINVRTGQYQRAIVPL